MTLDQCFLFWRMAIGTTPTIAPTASFNDEFEDGLLLETSDGSWRLNKRHPLYRAHWCEAFNMFARVLYTQSPPQYLFYLGHSADFEHWTCDVIDVLAVVEDANPCTVIRLNEVTKRLNQFLQKVPASWKKYGPVPRLQLHIQNANADWVFPKASQPNALDTIGLLHPEKMSVLMGNTAWFVHRNRITGLLVEPRLARCYASQWTPVAVDILVRGSNAHRLEFRHCWANGMFTHQMLEEVQPGLVRFLRVNDNLNPSPEAWSYGLKQFLAGQPLESMTFEGDTLSWLLHPSIP